MKHKILVTEHLPEIGWEHLKQAKDVQLSGTVENRAELLKAIKNAHAIIVRSKTNVDRELLEAGKNLKIVARAGAEFENIDVEEASRRGVMVMTAPDANVFAIVEHVFGLILALGRDLPRGIESLKAGQWLRHEIVGFQLHGKTLGVIGYGRLGKEITKRAKAFGLKVLVFDPYVDISLAREEGVEVLGFYEVLAKADILSLQTSLSDQTKGMMNKEAFAQIKKGAYLINCVQAELIDEKALLECLEEGRVAGAALDTFIEEPPSPDHPLINHPKVLATPHLNQNTIDSQNKTGLQIASNVLNALREEDFVNIINSPYTKANPYNMNNAYINLANRIGKLQGQTAEGRILRVEVELLGEKLEPLSHIIMANLLAGMYSLNTDPKYNWVSAPMLSHEQGLVTAQVNKLLDLPKYPNLLICKVDCENGYTSTIAGVKRSNGEASVVHYSGYSVNAAPTGNVLLLENDDVPGVIGKVGTQLGEAKINISNWVYGREIIGGRAVSFINVDSLVPKETLEKLEKEPEIHRAKLAQFD